MQTPIDPKKEIGCEKDEQFNLPVMNSICEQKQRAIRIDTSGLLLTENLFYSILN